MSLKLTRSEKWFSAAIVAVMCMIFVVIMYPLIVVVSSSLSNPVAVANGRVVLWPVDFTLRSFRHVFQDSSLLNGYKNTIYYTLVGTTINVIVTTMAAYALSKREFYLRGAVMLLFAFTMYFGGGTIPTYLVIQQLGLINNFWVMILPGTISVFNLIVMRSFFINTIPYTLYEVASIDGCSQFRMLRSVALPLSKPIIAVMVLYYSVGHWNSFFDALLYLQKSSMHPLQLVLRYILLQAFSLDEMVQEFATAEQLLASEGLKYAVIIVASVPMLVLYPFLQKYFVKGVMIGAIKG